MHFDPGKVLARGHYHRAFDHIAQLAHIARPVIALERGQGLIADRRR